MIVGGNDRVEGLVVLPTSSASCTPVWREEPQTELM
jgi:hypothetical protein